MSSPSIGFLGAGRMATALARGFIAAGQATPDRLFAADPVEGAREAFRRETGGGVFPENADVVAAADVLFLAVKPGAVPTVLAAEADRFEERHLIISIAAGVPIARLEAAAGPGRRVVRVMPNTPALVGASASGYALGSAATPADDALVLRLLSAVGVAFAVPEKLLDAVTGLSGSGPAYGFLMIEALADGGVAAGLPRDVAQRLAAQTLLGAARMVLETGLHPGALKDAVCSPGGTTIEAVHQLEKAGVRGALMTAVRAASERAARLG